MRLNHKYDVKTPPTNKNIQSAHKSGTAADVHGQKA